MSTGWVARDVRAQGMIEEMTLANTCLEHCCYLPSVEQMDRGQLCHPPTRSLTPGGPEQTGRAKGLVFSAAPLTWHRGLCHPADHPPSASGTSVSQGCFSGICCVNQKCVEFYTEHRGPGAWPGAVLYLQVPPGLPSAPWLRAGIRGSPSAPHGSVTAQQTLPQDLCLPTVCVPPRL